MKYFRKTIIVLTMILIVTQIIFIGINIHVCCSVKPYILNDAGRLQRSGVCLVPGAAVYGRNRISTVLEDRLETALMLYRAGRVGRFLLSGDHRTFWYDEVSRMRDFVVRRGVPAGLLLLDHGGYNTFTTMARARDVFAVHDFVIVTQRFHLDRAVYIARMMGLRAVGYQADRRSYRYRARYAVREYFARVKAFVDCMIDRTRE